MPTHNPDRPFGMPNTPEDIVATAHTAAPFVWRKRVSFIKRSAATQAVRGAVNYMRIRLTRILLARRLHPPYSDGERALLKKAGRAYRDMVWVHFFFDASNADDRARVKTKTKTALETIDALAELEKKVTSSPRRWDYSEWHPDDFKAHAARLAAKQYANNRTFSVIRRAANRPLPNHDDAWDAGADPGAAYP